MAQVEKRRSVRYAASGSASLADAVQANLVDLSAHGFRLAPLHGVTFLPGDTCQAHIALDSEPRLEMASQARVIWRERVGSQSALGLEFLDMDAREESDLRRMLDLLDPEAPAGEPIEGVHAQLSREEPQG